MIRRLAVALALLVPIPALAGGIAFVDAERAVATVDEGKAKLRELEAWAGPERAKLERLSARVNEVRQQIAAQGSVASPEVLQRLRDDELSARRAFEDAKRDFDRRLEKKQNEFLGQIAVKVGTVATDYAKANGLDAIFVLQAQPLIYVAESADLTDEIVRLYNERFPAATGE
jgi:Skp family chaperone for outer membrane proteins